MYIYVLIYNLGVALAIPIKIYKIVLEKYINVYKITIVITFFLSCNAYNTTYVNRH